MTNRIGVAVIGAGAMGHGIAMQCALTGHDVILVDHHEENLHSAKSKILETLHFLSGCNERVDSPDELLDNIRFTDDLEEGVKSVDLALETISENLPSKQALFERLSKSTKPDTILASNTSSLRITQIAEGAPNEAHRIVGCHWWYPPYLLKPVEIIKGHHTSQDTIDTLTTFVEAFGGDPILVKRDVPGFVWNRVQFAVIRECLHIVEEGIASVDDVNRAIRDGYAIRTAAVGPFETIDIAGIPLFKTIAEELYPHLAVDSEPPALFNRLIANNQLGIESGSGFFDYDITPEDVTDVRDKRIASIINSLDSQPEN